METKLVKLRSMLKEAISRKETMLIDFYKVVVSEMELNKAETDSSFNIILISFIKNRVKKINEGFKRKESNIIERELYLLSLLTYTLLDAKIKLVIEKNKVKINKEE